MLYMHPQEFSLEQIKVIEELRTALIKCREMQVMIAGLSDYGIFETTDSTGKPFISLY